VGSFFVLQMLVSAASAKGRTVGKHRRVVIQDAVLVIGGHSMMNLFIQILATAEISGQVDAFSHHHSIFSHHGR
jgi:uncharacterized paraquat-inducible protein A